MDRARRDIAENHRILRRLRVIARELVARDLVHRPVRNGVINIECRISTELGREREPKQALLPALRDVDLRDRVAHELSVLNEPDAAWSLSDEPVSSGQKGDAPRDFEPSDEALQMNGNRARRAIARLNQLT
jgi:hypothetical protein